MQRKKIKNETITTSQNFKKILLLIPLFLILVGSLFSQDFRYSIPKGAKLKTIEYKTTDYVVVAYFYKNQFLEGQNITFLSKLTQDTIISGKYYTSGGLSYINGIWKRKTENGITRAKGIFKITNSNGIGLTLKPKEGKPLTIITEDIYYYKGFRNKYPAILEKQRDGSYLLKVEYTDRTEMNDFIKLGRTAIRRTSEANRTEMNDLIKLELFVNKSLIDKYGFFALDEFIYYTTDVTRTYKNGNVFIGKVENTKTEDNYVSSILKEGKFIYKVGEIDEAELTKLPNNDYKYRVVYSDRRNDNNFKEMEIIVRQSLIEKYGFWATGDYVFYTDDVKYTYKNGDVFIGKAEHTRDTINNTLNSKFTEGEYKYASGEVFQGDLSGYWFCDIPITGKMKFKDGSIEEGNWLEKYDLTLKEAEEVKKGKSPTEKRFIAQKIYKEKQYKKAVENAEQFLYYEEYKDAKKWYSEALKIKPEESKFLNTQIEKVDELLEKQKVLNSLIYKYGEYYGELVYKKQFTIGMTKAMVDEIIKENRTYYKKSISTSSGKQVEIWEFNLEGANDALGLLGGGLLGGLAYLGAATIRQKCPTLIFTNGKLTDIYR